jgi:hypothetical protein
MAPQDRNERVAKRIEAARRKVENDRIRDLIDSGRSAMDIDYR